jgi:DNA replication protein DnaC
MEKLKTIQSYCKQLNLSGIASSYEETLMEAQQKQLTYNDYALRLFKQEIDLRERKSLERNFKAAKLPLKHNLEEYEYAVDNGISKTNLNQLRDLDWLDQIFNIVLMGPSGTGKTYIAAGLCYEAVKAGYKAYFRTMEELVNVLKMKDITRSAMSDYKRITKANLIVIDDIMMFPIEKKNAVDLFNFINKLHEKVSFIITTNKSPKQWAQMLDDEVLATALLDRLLYRCQIIKLHGESYRMKNRKNIYNEN